MKTFEAALVLGLLAGGHASAESLPDARAILRQADNAARVIQAEEQRFSALSKIAVAQSRAKDAAGALATVQQALSIPPAEKADASSLDALAALVAVQVEAGDRAGAGRTLERLLRAAATIDKPESVRMTVASAQAKVGDVGVALKTAGTSPLGLARVAAIQAEAGDRAATLTTLRQAQAAASAAPGGPGAWELAFIAAVQVKAGDQRSGATTFAEAVRIASGGSQPAASPLAFLRNLEDLIQVAAAQARVGDRKGAASTLKAALRYARQHPDDALRASHLTVIARALAEAGDAGGAGGVLREAHTIADKVPSNRREQPVLLLDIAEAHAEAGDVKEALGTLQHLWSSMWSAMGRQIIQQADAHIAGIRDERARAEAKAALSELVAKLEAAPRWTTGLRLVFHNNSQGLAKLATIQAKAGNQAEAASTFQQSVQAASLPFFGADRFSLRSIALAQAKAGDWQGAAAWAGKLAEPEARAHSLLGVAEGLLQRLGITMCDFPSSVAGC